MNIPRIYPSISRNLLDIFGAMKCKRRNSGYTNGSFLLAKNRFIWFGTLMMRKKRFSGSNVFRNFSNIFGNFGRIFGAKEVGEIIFCVRSRGCT